MITMLGSPRRCCDGLTRRETLTAGALTFLGGAFNLPSLLAAEADRPAHLRSGKAKSVILLYLLGGAATQDMYDLKPDAASGVKSEFQPIRTNVPGVHVCEHLPRTASWMHRTALIRSLNHKAGCHNCLPSYTGDESLKPDQHPRDTDPPSMGSVCEYLNPRRGPQELPDYIYMPNWLGWGQAFRRSGPYGGFLGKRYDAFTSECVPSMDPGLRPAAGTPAVVRGMPLLPNSARPADITVDRFNTRVSLLGQIDAAQRRLESPGVIERYSKTQQRAISLLGESRLKDAFDLRKEPARVVERYGNTLFGNSALVARRLVERGVRFVNVTFDLYETPLLIDYDAWDTHTKNFAILKDNKLPVFDRVYSALLEDLEARGLLDETLVFVTSEMGRTPRVNGNAGRDHWTYCYGSMLAGAGIKGGAVVGASDAQAAYVKDRPVSTTEICATIYHLLGINPDMPVHDRSGRPYPVAMGAQPIRELLA
jgi:hypothetical protein